MKPYRQGAINRARRLRREMTGPEKMLWKALRKPDQGFRRQVPIGSYIADFACLSARLIIEVDGGWHDLPERQLSDARRDEWLKSEGYRVVRFRAQQVMFDATQVADAIRTLLPRGEKGRVEGEHTEVWGEALEAAPPAEVFHQRCAPTLTLPSPLEGEGRQILPSPNLFPEGG